MRIVSFFLLMSLIAGFAFSATEFCLSTSTCHECNSCGAGGGENSQAPSPCEDSCRLCCSIQGYSLPAMGYVNSPSPRFSDLLQFIPKALLRLTPSDIFRPPTRV
jgi:hypothetical protein